MIRLAHLLPTFLLVAVFGVGALSAQGDLGIQGTIIDPSGAGIPNSLLTLRAPDGKTVQQVRTDPRGGFRVSGLAAGDFTVVVPVMPGFAEATLPIHLTSSIAGLKVPVALATINEVVNVGEEQPLSTDASANKDSVVVNADNLRKLPVFDQNFVAALTPFLDPGSAGSGGVTIIVDGVERKSIGVSPSAIQEVRINNDPYSAEFRSPGRGRIEILTKPGSPEFHAEANFLFRDATLNATNYFAQGKPPEQRRIVEGNLTGPVGRKKHTTFLLSGARREEDLAVAVRAFGPVGAIFSNVQTPNRNTQVEGRITHDFSGSHRLALQYNFEYSTDINSGVGALILPEAGTNNNSREDDLSINDRIIINPHLINQFQLTLEKDEDVARSTTSAVALRVNGAFTSGGAQADSNRTENTLHINEIVSYTRGRHYIRFGPNIPQMSRRAVDDQTKRLGIYSFASLANYIAGSPDQFQVQSRPGRGIYWINEIGAFVFDQISVTPRLQITAGLRYDWQTFVPDNNNFSPRLAGAYSLGSKTILRAGAGVFYDRTGGDFPATVKLHDGVALQLDRILKPGFPIASGTQLATIPTDLVRFAANVRAPYSFQYSAGFERALVKKLTFTAGYRGYIQAKSFRSRDANAPLLSAMPDAQGVYPRPNPSFGRIQQIESGGRQLYNAMDLALRGDVSRWFSGQVQYTLAGLRNNTGGINSYPQDQYHPNAEWARGDGDRRQRFNLIGNINPEHWLTLGVAAGFYSGAPYTETLPIDAYYTGLENARPAGVSRNTLQGSGTVNLDLSWEHDFHIDHTKGDDGKMITAQISGFNVINHGNFNGYVGTLRSPLFAQPTSASSPRQLQFQLGYKF